MASKALFTNRMDTLQVPINYPLSDWRYVALGMEPSLDEELVERAYWRQLRKYGPLARTNPEAARHLALINDAYRSLCPHTFEPWLAHGSGLIEPPANRHKGHAFDTALVYLLLLCMVVTSLLVLGDSVRLQTDAIIQSFIALIQHG